MALIVYICGPIAGKPNHNREAFKEAADDIVSAGNIPVNPHDISPHQHSGDCHPVYGFKGEDDIHDGGCHLRADISEMLKCDVLVRLPGWENSRGAMIEIQLAEFFGIPIFERSNTL